MKTLISLFSTLLIFFFIAESGEAQQTRDLQYFRSPDQAGINVFETSKETEVEFDGLRVRIGGANTLQFQGLSHENSGAVGLLDIGPNFNLATSNLDLDVQLHNGLRMHLRTYLSSRHHNEAWVKGGYLQIDRLDFIEDGFMSELMDQVTIKVGHMQINYGDTHFRRSDNGQAIHNPFVGNYLMDSFTTEVGGEVYYQNDGLIAMIGLTNGKLNQRITETIPGTRASFVGKLGYDSQINDDLRVRVTGSVYATSQTAGVNLYTGDRAGARYYDIMTPVEGSDFRSGRFNPAFSAPGVGGKVTAFMLNPFIKYQRLEFFGVYENATGNSLAEPDSRTFHQYGAELIYRFGADERIYLGGRYNLVSGEIQDGNDIDITRYTIGGGWFMTRNVLAKLEYVHQTYDGFAPVSIFEAGQFSGVVLEAVISF